LPTQRSVVAWKMSTADVRRWSSSSCRHKFGATIRQCSLPTARRGPKGGRAAKSRSTAVSVHRRAEAHHRFHDGVLVRSSEGAGWVKKGAPWRRRSLRSITRENCHVFSEKDPRPVTVAAHISVKKALPYSGQYFITARRGGPRRSRTSAPKVTSYRFHVLTRVMSVLLLEPPSVPRAATARDGTTDFYHAIYSHSFRSHSPAERTEGAMHPEGGEPVATLI